MSIINGQDPITSIRELKKDILECDKKKQNKAVTLAQYFKEEYK